MLRSQRLELDHRHETACWRREIDRIYACRLSPNPQGPFDACEVGFPTQVRNVHRNYWTKHSSTRSSSLVIACHTCVEVPGSSQGSPENAHVRGRYRVYPEIQSRATFREGVSGSPVFGNKRFGPH